MIHSSKRHYLLKTVHLHKAIYLSLDIENYPKISPWSFKIGLRRWLGQWKPIKWSNHLYRRKILMIFFKRNSPIIFWIANYNFYQEDQEELWQFTEKGLFPE
jgi:hypothetical protein